MEKEETVKEFQRHEADTGSDEVQAALTSRKIERLQEHLRGSQSSVSTCDSTCGWA